MKAIGVILTSGVGARPVIIAVAESVGARGQWKSQAEAVPLRLNKVGACAGVHVSAFANVGAHSCAPLRLNEVLAA